MNFKKTAALCLAAIMMLTTVAGLAGCGGANKMDYKEAVFSTGLTGYGSLEAFLAAENDEVSREIAYTRIMAFSGSIVPNRLDEDDIKKQLGFLTDSEVSDEKRI